MSNLYNEMFLENAYEEGLEMGMTDEQAEEYANQKFENQPEG